MRALIGLVAVSWLCGCGGEESAGPPRSRPDSGAGGRALYVPLGSGGTTSEDAATPVGSPDAGQRLPASDAAVATFDSGSPFDASSHGDGASSDASTGPLPSCMGLAATCGPDGQGDCCESLIVPGGRFTLGHLPGDPEEASCPALHCTTTEAGVPASVTTLRLDRYEVTVGRFRKFVDAGGPSPAGGAGKHTHLKGGGIQGEEGWDEFWPRPSQDFDRSLNCTSRATWTPAPGDNETRPITCITWYEAYAFCIWDGGFLPSEAEWEFAASGGEERVFPWSIPPSDATETPERASYDVGAPDTCMGDGTAGCTLQDLIFVGTKPLGNGRFGHSDMSGNVMEWALDWDDLTYPPSCDDCAITNSATVYRTVRGGCFECTAPNTRAASRFGNLPESREESLGVRCARPPR